MDFNDEQFENANSPIRDNSDPDSNVISESEEQSRKQELPTTSRVAGIEIDFNDEQSEKAQFWNCDNFDPDSNVISESEEQ
jgi:hypothetical protein